MHYAYVIYNKQRGFYKGHTHDLDRRIKEHNSGKVRTTRIAHPWELVYYEEFVTREEAVVRERYFKSAAGRRYLARRIGCAGSQPD